MKKFIIAILAVLYMGTSVGATLHMHYCMGKMAGWGLDHLKSKTCSKCGMEKNNGCCKDEYKLIKNDTDQKIGESDFRHVQLTTVTPPDSFIDLSFNNSTSLKERNLFNHPPPRSSSAPIFIRNCVFLI